MQLNYSLRRGLKSGLRYVFEKCGCGALSSMGYEHMDLQLVDLLGKKRNGVFIEAGANDGVAQSNTYYLEKILGWTGLLIEPLPDVEALCRRNRPRSITVNAALVRHGYPEATVEMEHANLMSMVDDGVISPTTVKKHLKNAHSLQQRDRAERITVPARPLSDILKENHLRHIDFFSLDVEGYEHEVLLGTDLNAVRIERILVETRDSNENEVRHHLEEHGYRLERGWIYPSYRNLLFHQSPPS